MTHLQSSPRMSGILLHPTSLPGRHGIGDLGVEARRFVDVLAAAGQRLWQVLPLGTIYEPWFSPYSVCSALAGNPLLISLELLHQQGLLAAEELEQVPPLPVERVDYSQAAEFKVKLLARACQAFQSRASAELRQQFEQFQQEASAWLEDYVLFMVLRKEQGRSWRRWEQGLRDRVPAALEAARRMRAEEVLLHKYMQFEFHRQWRELRQYANARGVYILGDVPIYVSNSSADVWAHREYFQFKADGLTPRAVSGAPPDDVFSSEGQRWGTPVYDWARMAADDYRWWMERLRQNMQHFNYVRLDHFPGFESYWAIPSESASPREGHWEQGPGEALFTSLQRQLGPLPVVVEDLGFITPAMSALRDRFNFPGMLVLQYALTSPSWSHQCREDCVLYTGTHDTNTSAGWFQSLAEPQRRTVAEHLGHPEPAQVPQEMMRLAWSSVARWAVAPLQDVLGLGGEGRMNVPGTASPLNWSWRFQWQQLSPEALERLASLTRACGRAPEVS